MNVTSEPGMATFGNSMTKEELNYFDPLADQPTGFHQRRASDLPLGMQKLHIVTEPKKRTLPSFEYHGRFRISYLPPSKPKCGIIELEVKGYSE